MRMRMRRHRRHTTRATASADLVARLSRTSTGSGVASALLVPADQDRLEQDCHEAYNIRWRGWPSAYSTG
jgi:hypothetical protein